MIQLKIKSVNKKILNLYCYFIKNINEKNNISLKEINIPKEKKLITLLKSPHVNKKAQEHFEIFVYKKTFYIKSNFKILKILLLNKPKQLKISLRKII